MVDGIQILRYPLRAATGGPIGLPARVRRSRSGTPLRLAFKVRRRGRIDVVHACNPPDLLFLVALALRPFGARFVFDHHDLVPELYLSRFGSGRSALYWVSRVLERLTFAAGGRGDLHQRELPRRGDPPREGRSRPTSSWSAAARTWTGSCVVSPTPR